MIEPNVIDKYVQFNKQTGAPEPIPWRIDVQPFSLYFDEQFTNGAFVVNAAGGLPTPSAIYRLRHASLEFDQGYGNPLLIEKVTFASNDGSAETTQFAQFTVFIRDMGDKTQFMNQPIHIRTFAGRAILAPKLFEPLFLPSRHVLEVKFNKITGMATNVYMFLWGQMYYTWSLAMQQYPQERERMFSILNQYIHRRQQCFPFWLTTEIPVSLAANQTAEYDMLIGNDGHFEGSHWIYVAGGPFQFELYDPDKKQTYMNGSVCNQAVLGDAEYPQELGVPMVVERGRRLRFKVTNLAGFPNNIWFTIRGRKIRADLTEYEKIKSQL